MTVSIPSPGASTASRRPAGTSSPKPMKRPPLHVPIATRPGFMPPTVVTPKVPRPMDLTTEVTELSDSRVKIAATVPSAEVERQLEHAAGHYAKEMRFPGFRKGKVPPKLVLQRLGREAVMEEALREGLPEWYERALLESKVTPVGDPKLDMPEPPA